MRRDARLNRLDDGCLVVGIHPLSSLDSAEDQRGTPSPRSDGNATDDSGIDSISERTDKCGQEQKKEADKRVSILSFALGDPHLASSVKTLPKAVHQDTCGSLKRHSDMMPNHQKGTSKGSLVELNSVSSRVKKAVMDLENNFNLVSCFF